MRRLGAKLGWGSIISFAYLFLYAPILVLILYSFNSRGFPSAWEGFTLRWYQELFFESAETWRAFGLSLLIAVFATGISICMATLFIYFKFSGGKAETIMPLFYGNLIFPETVVGISLMSYFLVLHIPLGLPTLIVSHTLLGMGFMIPVTYMKALSIDKKLVEASQNLGATHLQTFFLVIMPLVRPAMISCGLLIFILSFDDFALSFFCAGTKATTLSLHLLSMIRIGISPTMNALSFILICLSSILVIFFFSPKVRSRIF